VAAVRQALREFKHRAKGLGELFQVDLRVVGVGGIKLTQGIVDALENTIDFGHRVGVPFAIHFELLDLFRQVAVVLSRHRFCR